MTILSLLTPPPRSPRKSIFWPADLQPETLPLSLACSTAYVPGPRLEHGLPGGGADLILPTTELVSCSPLYLQCLNSI